MSSAYTAEALRFLYDFDHVAITRNCEGMTHEQSLLAPAGGGNCANWVLGHIVAHRGKILAALGGTPVWSEAEAAPYDRGSGPIDPARARPFADLLRDFEVTQERVRAGLEQQTPATLAAAWSPEDRMPRGQRLAFLQFHEAYHAGQLGLLRRLAGHPGAIR